MRAFQCDNCEDLVVGIPRDAVVVKVGRQDVPYRVVARYLHQTREPELCDKCLLEVIEAAVQALMDEFEKEEDDE